MGEQELLKIQQRKNFVIKFCYWAVIAVCIYTELKYLLPVLFPFVLAYGIAYMLDKPLLLAFIKKLNDKGIIHLLH